MIIPGAVLVEDDCSTQTPSWVDPSSCNWDCGQVHQEHSEPNWQRCQNLTIHIFTIIKFHENEQIIDVINQLLGSFKFAGKRDAGLTGTWESLALRLASVAEKTV